MSKERKIKRAKEIDILLQPFYDACKNKGLCVHECQFFDERHWNNGIHVKSWSGQRASINTWTKKVTFRDFPGWRFNFHVDNNQGCLQCNNEYNYIRFKESEDYFKKTRKIFDDIIKKEELKNGTSK